MTNFNIKVVSDNICPFCYLGAKRLDRAIAAHKQRSPSDTFTTTWSAYHLNPSAPRASEPTLTFLHRRFGPEMVEAMSARIKAVGQGEGINFTFAGKVGHTKDSHRISQLGKSKGKQNEVVREVMRMYFEEEGDITAEEDLVKAAGRAGIAEDEAREYLRSGKGAEEVDKEVKEAYGMGVTGVPHFVINNKWEVHGAEGVETFLEKFATAKKAEAQA